MKERGMPPFWNKSFRIMKLTFLMLLVGLMQVSASLYSQTTRLTLDMRNTRVIDVLEEIEKQSEYRFAYSSEYINMNRIVSININAKDIEETLKMIFDGTEVTHSVNDRHILLYPSATEGGTVSGQQKPVTGKVVDSSGIPLPGVTVVIKGTAQGTVTGSDGQYSIKNVPAEGTLIFSFVGMKTIEILVANQGIIDVTLEDESIGLEEVVAIGYGTMKKSDLTGAISSVSSDDFNKGSQMTAQQLIQGKVSGVNISQNSGKPGGANTIRVRGGTSITASNDPLYVIDGVPISTTGGVSNANISTAQTNIFDQEPTNPLQTLNPNDIESVIVLKDASATAIYGSRGANGVIIITTKSGNSGKVQISYDVTAGISNVAKTVDVLSADQYRKAVNDSGLALDNKGSDTNWQDHIYRTAYQHNHYLSMMGGTDKTTYRASIGYGEQEGIMLSSKMQQANIRTNINHTELDGRLTFDLRMNYGETTSDQSAITNTLGSEYGTSMNYEAYVFNPTYPILDADGNYNHVLPYRVNPVSFSTDVVDQRMNTRFLGNLATTFKIIDPLSIKVNLGFTRQSIARNSHISKNNPLGEGSGGYASVQKLGDYSKLLETILSFKKTYGKNSIDAIAGYSYQYFKDEGLHNTAKGFLSDEFKWYSLQAASTIESVSSYVSSNTLISMYGRVNYNYDNRFLLTATIRQDGSSRFGSGNKWGLFPSGAASWRISQEEFFQSAKISDLKLRVSYGITGNQEIGNLNSITTLGASSSGYLIGGDRITIVLPQQYANPDLKWEQTAQLDIGLNFGLFDQKIYGSFDYYRKETSDLLLLIAVPSPSVVSTQLANVGSVENKGIEFEIGAKIFNKKDFFWDANFNISANKNKVLSLSNDKWKGDNIKTAPIQGQGLSGGYAQLIAEGKPLGSFYGNVFTGIVDGVEQFEAEPDYIGSAQPDFTFGLSNTFSYKNWNLGINFRGSVGNDIYNLTANNLGYLINLPGRNVIPEAVSSGVGVDQAKKYSSRWIEDGSFIRLDNMTLGYNFDVNNSFLSNARVYISGQNLFVITGYSGSDPEVNSEVSGTGVAPIGIDYLSYPKARTISIGANISF